MTNDPDQKKMLILVGPQGSGNHVWSKIFGLHEDVYGWQKLQEKYWDAHGNEPFAPAWEDPSILRFPENYNYYVTSCSMPYVYKGKHRIPPVEAFCEEVIKQGVTPILAVLSRDVDILKSQQERVRDGNVTINDAFKTIYSLSLNQWLPKMHFLSYETLFFWKHTYLEKLEKYLKFPIDSKNLKIDKILNENANKKYISKVLKTELDKVVKKTYSESHHNENKWNEAKKKKGKTKGGMGKGEGRKGRRRGKRGEGEGEGEKREGKRGEERGETEAWKGVVSFVFPPPLSACI